MRKHNKLMFMCLQTVHKHKINAKYFTSTQFYQNETSFETVGT